MSQGQRHTDAERAALEAQLIALALAGHGREEMAAEVGLSRSTVQYWCKLLRAEGRMAPARAGRKPHQPWDDHTKPQREPPYEAKTRVCLGCQERFLSEWVGDRVCKRCKGTAAWRSGE